jgi:hypothetical protein
MRGFLCWRVRWTVLCLLLGAVVGSPRVAWAAAQDLLNDSLSFSGATLHIRPYVTMPGGFNDIISMTTRPGDKRLYVTATEGTIFAIDDDGNGNTTPVAWFNASSALQTATGRSMNGTDGQRGLQSVAFHPEFDKIGSPGYGKLYTTMLENRPGNPGDPAFLYLGNSTYGGGGGDGVLAEWTFDHNSGQVDANSYRELFRVNMPNFDHPIKQARFNPYAEPGDEDYGLLYMTHGDSNNQDSANDDPQDRGDVLGKMIRINPLQSGADRYTIPTTNPFYNDPDPNTLEEVYAYGFRNPHNFSFNPDDEGNTRILVGDIGRSNIEEVNLVSPGQNYGWGKREGTFIHLQGNNYPNDLGPDDAGYVSGVSNLLATEGDAVDSYGNHFVYPVAQWDHNDDDVDVGDDFTATAIASGFVINNGSDPDLQNQLIHFNFSFIHGHVYQTDFDEILAAKTSLSTGELPSELTQGELFRLHLSFDHDDDPNTPPQEWDDFNDALGNGGFYRNDGRIGEGVFGEMYMTSKTSGIVYLVTNTVPLMGDYNKNHVVDAADYTVWRDSLGAEGYQLAADGNGDGVVDEDDFFVWRDNFAAVWTAAGSGAGGGSGASAVPEPSSLLPMVLAAAWIARRRRGTARRPFPTG